MVCGLLLFGFPKQSGRYIFFKSFSSNSGRPCVGKTESQSLQRRKVSERRTLAGVRQRLVANEILLVKAGRKLRWSCFLSLINHAFANRCHLLNVAKNVGPAVVL